MNRIIKWLEAKFSQPRKTIVPVQRSNTVSVKSDEIGNDDCGTDVSFGHVPTVPDLQILDQSSPGIDKSTGFNPYDTVVLHEKQGVKKD